VSLTRNVILQGDCRALGDTLIIERGTLKVLVAPCGHEWKWGAVRKLAKVESHVAHGWAASLADAIAAGQDALDAHTTGDAK